MDTVDYNKMFNDFLAYEIDYCFQGLNFERDMLPCIRFVYWLTNCHALPQASAQNQKPVSKQNQSTKIDFTSCDSAWNNHLGLFTFKNYNISWVKQQYKFQIRRNNLVF